MSNTFSDDDTLAGLKRGDRDAFNRLFSYYYPRLMAFVSSVIRVAGDGGTHAVTEDITQDVFLYVWENRSKLHIGKGFHSYLFRSAYTRCLDYIRKSKRFEKYQGKHLQDYLDEYASLVQGEADVLEELYAGDFYRRLYQLLDELPPRRREIFLLTYMQGLKTKEIADSVRMPQRTVESHIYLAVKYLKERMFKKDFYLFVLFIGFSPAFSP